MHDRCWEYVLSAYLSTAIAIKQDLELLISKSSFVYNYIYPFSRTMSGHIFTIAHHCLEIQNLTLILMTVCL